MKSARNAPLTSATVIASSKSGTGMITQSDQRVTGSRSSTETSLLQGYLTALADDADERGLVLEGLNSETAKVFLESNLHFLFRGAQRQARQLPEELLKQEPEKNHVIDEVAPEHPFRLLQESKKPFQTPLPHPHGRALHVADYHVKGSAHTHGERNPHFSLVPAEKLLLFRRADGDEQQVGATVGNQLDDASLLFGTPVTITISGDLQAGQRLFIEVLDAPHGFLPGAEKEHAPCLLGRALHQGFEQVNTRNAFLESFPEQPRGPHHGHSVYINQRAFVDDSAQFRVLAGFD